jgi:hypothetical protein
VSEVKQRDWMTSGPIVAFLGPRRDNDVKIALGDQYVPIADIYYDSVPDSYVIELVQGLDLAVARQPQLWLTADVMDFLGVSRQRVAQLVEAYPDRLSPALKLHGPRGRRIWLADVWRDFERDRRRRGRK